MIAKITIGVEACCNEIAHGGDVARDSRSQEGFGILLKAVPARRWEEGDGLAVLPFLVGERRDSADHCEEERRGNGGKGDEEGKRQKRGIIVTCLSYEARRRLARGYQTRYGARWPGCWRSPLA